MNWSNNTKSFNRDHIFDTGQLVVLGISIVLFIVCLVVRRNRLLDLPRVPEEQKLVSKSSSKRDKTSPEEYRYNAYIAWLEGCAFISICFVISWATGVLDAAFFHPTWPPKADLAFYIFTGASFAIVVIGYWIIWPIGTVSYGRKWGWHCVLFGVLDGFAESQLFLCIWALVELLSLPRYATGIITFFLQGGFKANWDQRYWNIRVAPAHNIEEWNKWKVLFVHVPNVLVTFSYFITYGSATLYCLTQTLALIGSTSAMRFPHPFSKYTNPPLQSQIVSYADKGRARLWHVNRWLTE